MKRPTTPPLLRNRIIAAIIVGIVVVVALMTVIAGWSSHVDPRRLPLAGSLTLAYPALLIANTVLTIICIFISRRLMCPGLLAILLTLTSALDYCPLNFSALRGEPRLTPQQEENSFTMISFNAADFRPFDDAYLPNGENPTYEYFLEQDPDIIVIQEVEVVGPYEPWHLFAPQVKRIRERYPYILAPYRDGCYQAIFSKYPLKALWTTDRNHENMADVQAVKVSMPHGRELYILNVHMQSLLLTSKDKKAYTDFLKANINHQEISALRNKVYAKLAFAFRSRASQADDIRDSILTHPEMKNLIVTGDFNDVQNSWAVRHICNGTDLRNVYREKGFGPLITYYANHFLFRIDHTLYRGDLNPVYYHCDQAFRKSDHFPVSMKFVMTEDKKE